MNSREQLTPRPLAELRIRGYAETSGRVLEVTDGGRRVVLEES